VYGAITLYGATFQSAFTSLMVYDSLSARQNRPCGPTTPQIQRLPAITYLRFSLIRFRSPLLPESLLFSLPVGTEMFHFPTFPPAALCVQTEVPGLYSRWVSPFGHPRITGRLSPSRGFSQTPTSFIGSRCQGIHHVHLVACCYYKDARVHCEVLKIRSVPHKDPAPARCPLRGEPGGSWGYVVRGLNSYELIPQDPTVCLS
jgi:hypothetical protein